MSSGPTPEQVAEYLVRKLEQTIRDNRSDKGMSFSTWQTIAREEVTNALRAHERRQGRQALGYARRALIGATSVVTIGFWGAVVSVDRAWGGPAAVAATLAGAVLFAVAAHWGVLRAAGAWAKKRRAERLTKIEEIDRRIKRMEAEMRKKQDRLKDKMEEVGEL